MLFSRVGWVCARNDTSPLLGRLSWSFKRLVALPGSLRWGSHVSDGM